MFSFKRLSTESRIFTKAESLGQNPGLEYWLAQRFDTESVWRSHIVRRGRGTFLILLGQVDILAMGPP